MAIPRATPSMLAGGALRRVAGPRMQRHASLMLADGGLCARRQLEQYASHASSGAAGAAIYAREAGAISFQGNSWFAPWLEVGRISADGDTQADLLAAARVQFDLITLHACALHPALGAAATTTRGSARRAIAARSRTPAAPTQPAQARRLEIELGIGGRWSELQVGAIVLVEWDEEGEPALDASGAVGFVGLALPDGEAPAGGADANLYAEFWRGEGRTEGPPAVSQPGEFC